MADNDDWDDNDDGSQNDDATSKAPNKGLRAHAKKVTEENEQLKAKLADFESAARKSRVETAVKAKGFDAAVAKVVPADVASDDGALEKWLTEHETVFAKAPKETDQSVTEGIPDDVLEEDREGFMRVSRATSSALPPTKFADTRSAIASAKTREELNEILAKHGNTLVK